MNILTPNRAKLAQPVSNALDKILSAIGGVWSVEHHDDGTHANVTVDTLTVDTPAFDAGNVIGDLIPSKDNTYSLGTLWSTTARTLLAWKNLFLETAIYLGKDATSLLPTWDVTAIGTGVACRARVGTGQIWVFQNTFSATTFIEIGATASPGPSIGDGFVVDCGAQFKAATGFDLGVYERSRTTPMGVWITFTPTRTASAGTWTAGTLLTAAYMLVGKTLWVSFYITGTSVSNAGVELRVDIPGGFVAAKDQWSLIHANDNGAGTVAGTLVVTAGGTILRGFATTAAGGFGIAVTATDVKFTVAIEVQ